MPKCKWKPFATAPKDGSFIMVFWTKPDIDDPKFPFESCDWHHDGIGFAQFRARYKFPLDHNKPASDQIETMCWHYGDSGWSGGREPDDWRPMPGGPEYLED